MFAYGLLLLCSWIGWGFIVSKSMRVSRPDLGFLVGLGLASLIILGGVMNYLAVVSRPLLWVVLVAGLLAFCLYLKEVKLRLPKPNILSGIVTVVLMIIVLINYAAAVSPGTYNRHDDYQGYFVFVEKMIQTGHIGNDPYSERRIISSLGGQAFLDGFVLSVGQPGNLGLLDRGVAYLAFLIVVLSLAILMALPSRLVFLLMVAAALAPVTIVNITAVYTAMVLLLFFLRLIDDEALPAGRRDVLVAIIAASLVALKNSLIVPAALFATVYIIVLIRKGKNGRHSARRISTMLIVGGAMILPWMLTMLASSGTLFYPLLGKGYHGSVYGDFLTPTLGYDFKAWLRDLVSLVRNQPIYFLAAIQVLMLGLIKKSREAIGPSGLMVVGATCTGVILMAALSGGVGIERYASPLIIPTVIFVVVKILSSLRDDREDSQYEIRQEHVMAILLGILVTDIFPGFVRLYPHAIVLVLILWLAQRRWQWRGGPMEKGLVLMVTFGIIGGLIWSGLHQITMTWRNSLGELSFGWRGQRIDSIAELQEYAAMQASVPAGTTLLVRLSRNYLLDFSRNQVYIADYPGGSSLPPGLPFRRGPESLASYLLDRGIRYIAYSYAEEANFTMATYGDRLTLNTNPWVRTEAEHAFDYQDNLKTLGLSRKILYDDGKIFVLDLKTN